MTSSVYVNASESNEYIKPIAVIFALTCFSMTILIGNTVVNDIVSFMISVNSLQRPID
jgi:hypothetical protein